MSATAVRNKPILVIIMVGLIGTGKSTLAQALSERLGATCLSSDIIRKKLAGIPEIEHRLEKFEGGIYSSQFTGIVYDTMFVDAVARLMAGDSVILDASFAKKVWRLRTRGIAYAVVDARFLAIECVLDESIVRERLDNRKDTPSDGQWEIYQEQKKVFEPVVELPPEEHIVVDTSKPVDEIVGEVLNGILP